MNTNLCINFHELACGLKGEGLTENTRAVLRRPGKMHEIVTLQLGQRANYLATHFWNLQVLYKPPS